MREEGWNEARGAGRRVEGVRLQGGSGVFAKYTAYLVRGDDDMQL